MKKKKTKNGKKYVIFSLFVAVFAFFVVYIGIKHDEKPLTANELMNNEEFMIKRMAGTSNLGIYSVNVNGSVATVNAYGTVTGYYVGYDNPNLSASSTYFSGATTSNTYYAGVKNGTYYFWVSGLHGSSMSTLKYPQAVVVTTSCSNEVVTDHIGKFTIQRCRKYENGTLTWDGNDLDTIISCAAGYYPADLAKDDSDCKKMSIQQGNQAILTPYCKSIITGECKAIPNGGGSGGSSGGGESGGGSSGGGSSSGGNVAAAASLTSIGVSSGELSPAFSSSVKSYTVVVEGNVETFKVTAEAASGSTFVKGEGPRTVKLEYGENKIPLTVKNVSGKTTTYNLVVTRTDNRSEIYTLSSLKLSEGTLEPEFSPLVTTYNVKVPNGTTKIKIDATLTDSNSTFVPEFGPREVELIDGFNNILIKIKSQNGYVNTYTLNIVREDPSEECLSNTDEYALLKGVEFANDVNPKGFEFDSQKFTYNVRVPYDVRNLIITAYTKDDADEIAITGGNNLEVNIEQEIAIVVKSKHCANVTKTYTIGVTRESEKALSDEAELSNIIIKDHDEFEFKPNEDVFDLKLNKGEKRLTITLEQVNENATCEIEGNDNLSKGSRINIKCVSEDGYTTVNYVIKIVGVKKGTNMVLVVFIVILILLVLIYLVLRLLGYKIYFNFSMIGAFFRGIKEKISNIFNK